MDVLDLHESPAQGVQRMDEAKRRAELQRRRPDEAPRVGPYAPDESLGDRGLALPVAIELPDEPSFGGFDRDATDNGHEKDHDKDHDKGRGGRGG